MHGSHLILTGCARFTSTVTERLGPDGRTVERITVVKAGTFFDSKSDLAKLSSGQTDKTQKVSIGSINQESLRTLVAAQSATNAQVAMCIERNSRVLEECRDELRFFREERQNSHPRNPPN